MNELKAYMIINNAHAPHSRHMWLLFTPSDQLVRWEYLLINLSDGSTY
jgi:hypothetical protein